MLVSLFVRVFKGQIHGATVTSHTHNLGFHLFVPEVKPRSLRPESLKRQQEIDGKLQKRLKQS